MTFVAFSESQTCLIGHETVGASWLKNKRSGTKLLIYIGSGLEESIGLTPYLLTTMECPTSCGSTHHTKYGNKVDRHSISYLLVVTP